MPWAPPGLHLTGLEGAGEVQTPADRPPGRAAARSATWCGSGTRSRASCSSTPTPCSCWRGDAVRRRGADLPRLRERLVSNASEVLDLAALAAADPRAGPAGLRRRTGRLGQDHAGRGARDADRRAGGPHGRPVRGLGRAARGSADQLDTLLSTARRRASRAATGAGTGRATRWAETVVGTPGAPAGPRGRRLRVGRPSRGVTTVLAWVEVPYEPADGPRPRARRRSAWPSTGSSGPPTSRSSSPASAPASAPTWSSTAGSAPSVG